MILKPVTSEKAVKLIDLDNTLIFEVPRISRKAEIQKQIETIFTVKVEKIRTFIRNNRKYAYAKLAKENPAIDIATKLGMI
ncbi:50S ribosomal protein L23 [Candidatus Pacearchaeota archaeon]|jgi:large subunit ribosomal protein L23|nr:50S ribosomal protein L23 [Candidatus Pacearchaeota archaeon]|tara:strand:+ start:6735 stop:6977 length:243 start_codon:yes stop_codon:yes gene_type:complete